MQRAAFDDLVWREQAMPGASGPVLLARLPDAGDGAFRAWVRFPAGWSRLQAGHYAVPEQFTVVEGALELNGKTFGPGSYAWIPALETRTGFSTPAGALVLVWFGGTPRWVAGAAAARVAPDAPGWRSS